MVLEKTLESPLDCKEIQLVHPKGDQSWVFNGRTDAEAETPNTSATSCEELTHWKRPWCWEWLGTGGERDDRGWDGWMASPTRWTRIWVNSGSWWWTGRPGVLRFMGSQRVRHDWATELNWSDAYWVGSYVPPLWRQRIYINYLKFLCRGDLSTLLLLLSIQLFILKENRNTNLKRYIHPCVYYRIIYYGQDMRTTYVCRQMTGTRKMWYSI